jgi:pentatricopeptide repeat protein
VVGIGVPEDFSSAEAEVSISGAEFSTAEAEIFQPLDPEVMFVASSIHEAVDHDVELQGHASRSFTPMDICQDPSPFKWSQVDVLGSPGLSHLLQGLQIESSAHIPPLSLDERESDDPSCLSSLEIHEIFNSDNKTGSEYSHKPRPLRLRKYLAPTEQAPKGRHPHHPWRDIEAVFCGYSPSPLTEIYIFPPSPSRKRPRKPDSDTPTCTQLVTKEKELRIKVAKLRSQFQEDNPAIIAAMEELAHVFYELRKYREAESIYRKVVDLCQRTFGPHHIWTLSSSRNVILSLKGQGYFSKAKHLNNDLRGTICNLFPSHHPLSIRVSKVDAWLAEALGETKDCESTRREILQMALASYGPRHPDTMEALSLLGYTISQMGTEEGGTLLRTAVELSLQDPYQDGLVNCTMMIDLAYALNFNGAYEESYKVATSARERFRTILESQHIYLISLEEQVARSLLEVGRLAESEKLVRNLVSLYASRNLGTHNSDVSNAWCGLGNVLAQMGQRDEATGWYEKFLQMRIHSDMGVDTAFITTGYNLVYCYQEQGRLEDALNVYHQMMNKFAKSQDIFTMAWKSHIASELMWIEAEMGQSSDEWYVTGDSTDTEDDEESDEMEKIADERINCLPDVELEGRTDIQLVEVRTAIL